MFASMTRAKIRLYVDQPLGAGQLVALSQAQARYLFAVMRLGVGASVAVFNGRDGEWLAEVVEAGKRGGALACVAQSAPQRDPPDLWLLFAPIKKARTDFIVEKAAEMGASRICPVQTDFTNAERIRRDRLQAHAVEAAEQSGGTFVPEVADLRPLSKVLEDWPQGRRLMIPDETLVGVGATLGDAPSGLSLGPWAIMIGPEGGFSQAERNHFADLPFVTRVSLGPRILRADTAAVAAMTLWQTTLGDWG